MTTEEAVLYPALAMADQKGHAVEAYTEQSAAKLNLGLLENLAPMTEDYLDKLEHIRHAVALHVYQEESTWFLELARMDSQLQVRLGARYLEEFGRYMGGDGGLRSEQKGATLPRTAWPGTSDSEPLSRLDPAAVDKQI